MSLKEDSVEESEEVIAPKKRKGTTPKKIRPEDVQAEESTEDEEIAPEEPEKRQKGPGRPRKPDSEKKVKDPSEKRGRGRPRNPDSERRTTSTHPAAMSMVLDALNAIEEDKNGTSHLAIRKYILQNYTVNPEKIGTFIKRALRYGVAAGQLKQVAGRGAIGSYRLYRPGETISRPKKKKISKKGTPAKVGRPKKSVSAKTTPKKTTGKVGRPKKSETLKVVVKSSTPGKRGRPKSSISKAAVANKTSGKRGRPKKSETLKVVVNKTPGKRGRPRKN